MKGVIQNGRTNGWLVSLCILGLQPAIAQESGSRAQLEEVYVTAQRRTQDIQDVPIAMAALGRELLENNEINSVEDIGKLVPSLRYSGGFDPATSSIRIRGVGTGLVDPGVESNVSVVVDDVPLARQELISFEFADIERIEVLRGPQGTLFGKNATAGLMHVITRDPSEQFESFVRLNYERPQDWSGWQAKTQLGVSGPLSDSIGARLTGFYKEVRGHLNDIQNDEHLPNSETWGLRGKLRWDPNDFLTLKFMAETQRSDGQPHPFLFRGANPDKAAAETEIEFHDENRDTRVFPGSESGADNDAVSLSVDWEVGNWVLTSITGYRDFSLYRGQSAPKMNGSSLDLVKANGPRLYETLTQEIRLTSNVDGTLNYSVGALWFDNRVEEYRDILAADVTPSLAAQGSGIEGILDVVSSLNDSDRLEQTQDRYAWAENQSLGVFGQAIWHLADVWHLTAGARYIEEKQTAFSTITEKVIHSASGAVLIEETRTAPEDSFTDTDVIGTLSLQYDWGEHTTLYGTVSTGYRGGAYNIGATDPPAAFADPVDPEKAVNTELGSKSRLFDRRLELNIAIFRTLFKDFQAQVVEVQSADGVAVGIPIERKLDNAGELETRGVEIDFMAQPTESLFVAGSLMYNDAKYNEFLSECFTGQQPGEAGGIDETGDGACDRQDISGAVLANAPKYSASLTTRYEAALGDGENRAYAQLTGQWQDEVQFDNTQHPYTIHDPYSIWDLRLGWIGSNDRLELALYVKNLFNKFYSASLGAFSVVNDRRDLTHFVSRNANRQFGMTISYRM